MRTVALDSSALISSLDDPRRLADRLVERGERLVLSPRAVLEALDQHADSRVEAFLDVERRAGGGRLRRTPSLEDALARERAGQPIATPPLAPWLHRLMALAPSDRAAQAADALGAAESKRFTKESRARALAIRRRRDPAMDNSTLPAELIGAEGLRGFVFAKHPKPLELPEEDRVDAIERAPLTNRAALVLRAWVHLKTVSIAYEHQLDRDRALSGSDANDWIDGMIAAECAYADVFETEDVRQANALSRIVEAFGLPQQIALIASA